MSAKLTVISGCMFSGKSSELIRRLIRAQIAKKSVVLVRPAIDNRSKLEEARTRLGVTFPSIPTAEHALELLNDVEKAGPPDGWPDVLGIDEAQFFEKYMVTSVAELLTSEVEVIVAGLNTDFLGRPFGPMPLLMAMADEVITVTAICMVCGNEATRTQRLIDGKPASFASPLIVVGDSEKYEARCRLHHEV